MDYFLGGIFFFAFWAGVGLCFLGLWGMGLLSIIIGVCAAVLINKYDAWSENRLLKRVRKDRPYDQS